MIELAAGDFVRWMKQLLDLAGQVADAAGDGPLRETARGVVTAVGAAWWPTRGSATTTESGPRPATGVSPLTRSHCFADAARLVEHRGHDGGDVGACDVAARA